MSKGVKGEEWVRVIGYHTDNKRGQSVRGRYKDYLEDVANTYGVGVYVCRGREG